MAKNKFTNNAKSKLAGALTNIATSLSVTASEGALFPILGAGEWFMAVLVKLVGGLPVYEIVKVTARSGDNFTILRAQDSTTATTFSAGDIIELRVVAGSLGTFAQQDGDNTFTAANDFTGGSITVPTAAPGDADNSAASTAFVATLSATKAANGANSDITALNALQTAKLVHSVPQLDWDENDQTGAAGRWRMVADGNTWKFLKNTAVARDFSTFLTPMEVDSAGNGKVNGAIPVQQGTGVGQGGDAIKIGWGAPGGGLRFTLNTTDFGFIPLSTANPNAGTISFNGTLTMNNGSGVALTANGSAVINYGLAINGQMTIAAGGTIIGPANAGGYLQSGPTGGDNIVFDGQQIQARNNGVQKALYLNFYGGTVNIGGNTVNNADVAVSGGLGVTNGITSSTTSYLKITLKDGASTRGYIGADNTYCFRTVNAGNTLFTSSIDNSGNLTVAGDITANSDERLKENWRDLPEDFLDALADLTLLGIYDRIDTGETQLGMSAQQVQRFAPWLVKIDPETSLLSLDYGKLGGVSAARLAQVVRNQRREIDLLKQCIGHVMQKLEAQ